MGGAAGIVGVDRSVAEQFGVPGMTMRDLTPDQLSQWKDAHPSTGMGSLGIILSVLGSVLAGPLGPALGGALGISSGTASGLIAAAGGAAGGVASGGGLKGALLGGLSGGLGYGLGNMASGALTHALGGAAGAGGAAGSLASTFTPAELAGAVSPLIVPAATTGLGGVIGGSLGGAAGSLINTPASLPDASTLDTTPTQASGPGNDVTSMDPITVTAARPSPELFGMGPSGLPEFGNALGGLGASLSGQYNYDMNGGNKPFDPRQTAIDTVGQTVGNVGADLGVGALGQALGLVPGVQPAAPGGDVSYGTVNYGHPNAEDPYGGMGPPGQPGGGGSHPLPTPVSITPGSTPVGTGSSGGGAPGAAAAPSALLSTGGAAASPSAPISAPGIKTQGSAAPDIYPWRKMSEAA